MTFDGDNTEYYPRPNGNYVIAPPVPDKEPEPDPPKAVPPPPKRAGSFRKRIARLARYLLKR